MSPDQTFYRKNKPIEKTITTAKIRKTKERNSQRKIPCETNVKFPH